MNIIYKLIIKTIYGSKDYPSFFSNRSSRYDVKDKASNTFSNPSRKNPESSIEIQRQYLKGTYWKILSSRRISDHTQFSGCSIN